MRAVLIGVLAALLGGRASGQDVPQWRGVNRDGAATFAAPSTWPDTLTRKWKVEVGTGYAAPIVVADRIFAFSRQGEDEVMRALDAATGKTLWETRYNATYKPNPAATRTHGTGPKSKRVEVRFPDALANPYLAYAALLMAGLDGIQNKIHPGEAMDKNLYDLPPAELAQVPTVAGSLREALDSLAADHDFLLKGDVFTKDQIESYIELKMSEVMRWEMTPSPVEYDMYYSG